MSDERSTRWERKKKEKRKLRKRVFLNASERLWTAIVSPIPKSIIAWCVLITAWRDFSLLEVHAVTEPKLPVSTHVPRVPRYRSLIQAFAVSTRYRNDNDDVASAGSLPPYSVRREVLSPGNVFRDRVKRRLPEPPTSPTTTTATTTRVP